MTYEAEQLMLEIDELRRELSTLRAERDALQRELVASDAALRESRANDMESMRQLNALQARIAESEKQEPMTHVIVRNVDITTGNLESVCKLQSPLYTRPFVPPAGMMLVPVELTPEMIRAFHSNSVPSKAWKDMLSAAPAKEE
jgi:hypothetical protein